MKRAVIGKEGALYTVILDGVLVGQSLVLSECEATAAELNESDEKCQWLRGFCEIHDGLEGLEPPNWTR